MAVPPNRGGLNNINSSSRPLDATLDARAELGLTTGAAASADGIGDWILRARKPYTAD